MKGDRALTTNSQLSTLKSQIPKGYKQTEVGVIPDDWNINAVGEICDFIVPGRNKPKQFQGDIPWITTPDLEDGRSISESRIGLFVSRDEAKNVGSKVVPSGSVLMSCVGELGIVALVEREIVINQQLHAFIPTSKINSSFLMYALQAQKNFMLTIATITAVPYLNKDNCNSIPIPLPPTIAEQNLIARALSDTDALIESLEQLLAKKRQIKQGAMQELLTGKRRVQGFGEGKGYKQTEIGMIPEDWDVVALDYLIKTLDAGVSVNSAEEKSCLPHEKSILKTSCVFSGDFVPGECKPIIPGDISRAKLNPRKSAIIISRMNTPALVGECGYVDRDYPYLFLPDRLWMTRPDENKTYHSRWLAFLLSFSSFNKAIKDCATGTSGSMKNISKNSLLSIKISLPIREEQQAIATILSDMDLEIGAIETKLTKARQLKQGMMHELLTGRIRLVEEVQL